jgi:hypothetical protein
MQRSSPRSRHLRSGRVHPRLRAQIDAEMEETEMAERRRARAAEVEKKVQELLAKFDPSKPITPSTGAVEVDVRIDESGNYIVTDKI